MVYSRREGWLVGLVHDSAGDVIEEARGGQGSRQSRTLSGMARSLGIVLKAMGRHRKILSRGMT